MKKSLLLLLLIIGSCGAFSQTVSITGAAAGSSGNVVVGQNTYHASESIYLDAEIGATNFVGAGNGITRIEFAANSTSTATFPISVPGYSIYMKNVSTATATFTTGTYSLTGYTLVYTGSLSMTSTGAQYSFTFGGGVDLTTPFERTSGTNLQVLIIRNSGTASAGLVFDCSNGNSTDATGTITTSRRYNSTVVPAENSSSLTASNFRPAIKFIRALSNDAALTAFLNIPSPSCYNSSQSFSVTLKNAGSSSIAASAAPVTLQISGANTFTSTVSNSSILNSGNSTTITFTGVTLNNVGVNNVKAFVSLTGDASTANDTLKTTITTTTTTTTFPVIAGADASPLYFEFLKITNGSRQLWGLNSTFTASTTGAYKNTDLTDSLYPKTGNGFYMYDNYSGASSVGNSVILYSNCFAFPAANGTNVYDMSFWMSQDNSFNTDLDSVYAVVTTDRGASWTRILPGFGRVNASFTTPGWIQRTVDLTAYAGQTIQIGFEGVSKYGNVFGIDDIKVRASNPLPVTFANFTGIKSGIKNVLSWSTTAEINNKEFELQRSVNGIDFATIATIASKSINGNSNSQLNYTFNDNLPNKGANYYRLKQIDKDDKYNYSKIVLIKDTKTDAISLVSIYPNPVREQLNIIISSGKPQQASIILIDALGKVVLQKQVQLTLGEISFSQRVANLKSGVYVLKVIDESNNTTEFKKVIKE